MAKLFETKYRILPVYAKNELVGYVVYFKVWWFPFAWIAAQLDNWVTTDKNKDGFLELNRSYAFFKSEEEAIKYIKYRKTNVNETLRVQQEGDGNADGPQKG